jgi:ATP phosphoribosyltransferase regulatory subunit
MYRKHWLLPEGIEELLPAQALQLEQQRRILLDLYASWGYQLVIPPLVEYRDALLTGTEQDLALQTATLTDQISGRLLGIRADITPQTARIDAHKLQQQAPTRLCYIGSVLHAQPNRSNGTRNPLQIGAELYGHDGLASDQEIVQLMLTTLQQVGIDDIYLDLGHVAIYRSLAEQAGLDNIQKNKLFAALQRKAKTEIASLLEHYQVAPLQREMLQSLADLNGEADILDQARQTLAAAPTAVHNAIDYLQQLGQVLNVPVHYDLVESRTYDYQTGVVFAAFVPGQGYEIARGGRCDNIGEAFGRARPATGFSTDLKTLLALGKPPQPAQPKVILAPTEQDPTLTEYIAELRATGHTVIQALPGQAGTPQEQGVQYKLQHTSQGWTLIPV